MVFGQVFLVLASLMSSSITYDAKTGVGEARNDNIIEFSDRIYTKLGRIRHLEDSDYFPKKRLVISQIVKSCKSVPMGNAPIFAYPFQTTCLSSFVLFTLLTRFSNLW